MRLFGWRQGRRSNGITDTFGRWFLENFRSPRENHISTCLREAWALTDTGAHTWPGNLLFKLQIPIPTPALVTRSRRHQCRWSGHHAVGSSRGGSLAPVPLVALRGCGRGWWGRFGATALCRRHPVYRLGGWVLIQGPEDSLTFYLSPDERDSRSALEGLRFLCKVLGLPIPPQSLGVPSRKEAFQAT